MARKFYYDVYDEKLNRQIGAGLDNSEVRRLIGISNKANFADYADQERLVSKRYRITLSEGTESYEQRERNGVWAEWDKMCQVAQMIRDGKGKIVTEIVDGKRVKYTVPIGD